MNVTIFLLFTICIVFVLVWVYKKTSTPVENIYLLQDFPILVYYDYDKDRSTNLGNEYLVVLAAINDINHKTNFNFFHLLKPGLVPDDIHTVLHISDRAGKHECLLPFDGRFGVLAHSYYPPIKKICIDSSEEWTSIKLANTLVHEMCHSLGLKHRNNVRSIMNPVYSEKINGIQPEDVKFLRKMYPFI